MINASRYFVLSLFALSIVLSAEDKEATRSNYFAPATCLSLEHKGKKRSLKIIEENVICFYETNDNEIREYLAELKKKNPDQGKILEIRDRIRNSWTNLAFDRKRNKRKLQEDYEAYKKFVREKEYTMKTDSAKNMNISTKQYLKMVRKLRDFLYR